jgi:hypothetical protein
MRHLKYALLGLALVMTALPPAQAQWVFVAKKVLGRVNQMTTEPEGTNPGFAMASVIVGADAKRVFQVVSTQLHANPALRVLNESSNTGKVNFARGGQSAGISVVALNPTTAQMTIAASIAPNQTSPMPELIAAVQRVCAALKKACIVE